MPYCSYKRNTFKSILKVVVVLLVLVLEINSKKKKQNIYMSVKFPHP